MTSLILLHVAFHPHKGGRGSTDAGGPGSPMYGGNNSLAVAVYDGHGGDAVSKDLERVLLNVSPGEYDGI